MEGSNCMAVLCCLIVLAVQQRLATLQAQQRMLQRDVEEARKALIHHQSDQGADRQQQQQDTLPTPRSSSSRCSSRAHQHLQLLTPGGSNRLKRVSGDAVMASAGSCTLSRNNSSCLPPLGPTRCNSSCSARSVVVTPGLRDSSSTEGGEAEDATAAGVVAEAPEASGGHILRGQELYAGRLQNLLDCCGPVIGRAAKGLADMRQKFLWCAEYFSEDVVTGKVSEKTLGRRGFS